MKKVYFVVAFLIGCICCSGLFAATAKYDIEMQIKNVSDAKKLYKFLESNKGKIVKIKVSIPQIDPQRVNVYNLKTTREYTCRVEILDSKNAKVGEQIWDGVCPMEGEIISHHFGNNIIGKDKSQMNEKYKKDNIDMIVAGKGSYGYNYYLDNGYIIFEEYLQANSSNFYSIKLDDFSDTSGLDGLYYVDNNYTESILFLESSYPPPLVCLDVCEDIDSVQSLKIEKIEPKYIELFRYLNKK